MGIDVGQSPTALRDRLAALIDVVVGEKGSVQPQEWGERVEWRRPGRRVRLDMDVREPGATVSVFNLSRCEHCNAVQGEIVFIQDGDGRWREPRIRGETEFLTGNLIAAMVRDGRGR